MLEGWKSSAKTVHCYMEHQLKKLKICMQLAWLVLLPVRGSFHPVLMLGPWCG